MKYTSGIYKWIPLFYYLYSSVVNCFHYYPCCMFYFWMKYHIWVMGDHSQLSQAFLLVSVHLFPTPLLCNTYCDNTTAQLLYIQSNILISKWHSLFFMVIFNKNWKQSQITSRFYLLLIKHELKCVPGLQLLCPWETERDTNSPAAVAQMNLTVFCISIICHLNFQTNSTNKWCLCLLGFFCFLFNITI